MSDAGEPHGTAGRPMLNALLHSGVGDVVAVVTRYYGGTKLGTGGLVRAYGGGVQQALATLPRGEHVEYAFVRLVADYARIAALQQLFPAFEAEVARPGLRGRRPLRPPPPGAPPRPLPHRRRRRHPRPGPPHRRIGSDPNYFRGAAPGADGGDFVRADVEVLEELLVSAGAAFSNSWCQRRMSSSLNPAARMIATHRSFVIMSVLLKLRDRCSRLTMARWWPRSVSISASMSIRRRSSTAAASPPGRSSAVADRREAQARPCGSGRSAPAARGPSPCRRGSCRPCAAGRRSSPSDS